jgi:hypothetical protein
VKGALAVEDERPRQGAELAKAGADPPADVLEALREDERPGAGARVAHRRNDHPAAPRLAVADRDLGLRLPEVELADLAGAVDGPLVGPRRTEDGAQLADVVIEDRLAAGIALLAADPLTDHRRGDLGVGAQELVDARLMGVELRRARRAAVDRWALAAKRAADRVSVTARAPCDLADRQPVDLVHPPDLGPLAHVQHCLPPRPGR